MYLYPLPDADLGFFSALKPSLKLVKSNQRKNKLNI